MNERASENGRDAMKRGRSEGRWQNIMILFEKKRKTRLQTRASGGKKKKKNFFVFIFPSYSPAEIRTEKVEAHLYAERSQCSSFFPLPSSFHLGFQEHSTYGKTHLSLRQKETFFRVLCVCALKTLERSEQILTRGHFCIFPFMHSLLCVNSRLFLDCLPLWIRSISSFSQ